MYMQRRHQGTGQALEPHFKALGTEPDPEELSPNHRYCRALVLSLGTEMHDATKWPLNTPRLVRGGAGHPPLSPKQYCPLPRSGFSEARRGNTTCEGGACTRLPWKLVEVESMLLNPL